MSAHRPLDPEDEATIFTESELGLFAEHPHFTVFPNQRLRLTEVGRFVYGDALVAMQSDMEASYPIDEMIQLLEEGAKRIARRDRPPIASWGPLVDALHDQLAHALFVERNETHAAELSERCRKMIAHVERMRAGHAAEAYAGSNRGEVE